LLIKPKNFSVMNESQVMEVFRGMVLDSRARLRENSFYYLMWGWVVVICCLVEWGLMQAGVTWHWAVWPVAMPIAGAVSMVRGIRQGQREQHTTALDRMMGYLWGGWGALLLLVLLGAPRMGWDLAYGILMAMYGLGTFVSGGMLGFKPLVYGGIAAWVIALVAILMPGLGFEAILWLLAASICVSYLIPGYLLLNAKG
jgi:hypothetical protein